MTREEHIENLKAIALDMPSDKCSDWIESLMDGVKALEQEPCGDAISRKKVIDTIYCECSCENLDIDFAKVLLLQRAIKALSPVTPQPKMGRWIEDTNGTFTENHDTWECSECGHAQILLEGTPTDNDYNYCPNCGCKMQEVEE